MNHQNENMLDDELARLADTLINGESALPSAENQRLYEISQAVYQTINPTALPNGAFRLKLQKELIEAWQEEQQKRSSIITFIGIPAKRLWQGVGIAATIIVLVALGYLLSNTSTPEGQATTGTAMDSTALPFIGLIAIIFTGFTVFLWWKRRR